MKTIVLPASPSSDLDWSLQLEEMKEGDFLVHLDFGWGRSPFFLSDLVVFQTFSLALDQFSMEVWPLVKDRCQGVILFRGSLDILSSLIVAGEELSAVEAATVFGDYLHRLASFLPDDATPYCLFDDRGPYSLGEAAHLLAQDRFWHLRLALDPSEHRVGVLLPQDELCSPVMILELDQLLREKPEIRVIPERRLSELWNGLDELIVFEESVTAQGRRQLAGFEAAGGEIIHKQLEESVFDDVGFTL